MDQQEIKILIDELCKTQGVDDNPAYRGWNMHQYRMAEFLKKLRSGELVITETVP